MMPPQKSIRFAGFRKSRAQAMWHAEMEWIEPREAAARLSPRPGLCWLDSAMVHPTLGRYSSVAIEPFGCFTVDEGEAFWNGARLPRPPLIALRESLARFPVDRVPGLPPFQGGAIGTFDYEFGWALDHGPSAAPPPVGRTVHLDFHDTVLAFDHVARRCWIVASGWPAPTHASRLKRAEARMASLRTALETPAPRGAETPTALAWRPDMPRGVYTAAVERVKDYIAAGDIYQANIAQGFSATVSPTANRLRLYDRLRATNPAPFAAYLDRGPTTILCTSPERLLRTQGRLVETRPIKGTAQRAPDAATDADLALALLNSPKDRAENVMIVDLLRNDLSRVCEPRSVEVPVLCGLESYAGLHHLVSVVTGELSDGRDALDLLGATFPGGSITGAPKLRAMEIIAAIEGKPRGLYCGAIGAIGFDGDIDLNIAIRTVVIEDGTARFQTGGGITILSDPDQEYAETLTKARRIFDAFAPADPRA